MSILFVEQLTVIDCAYLDAARGLVGESWIVDVELEGELDDQSMVLDFGEVKKRLKRAIDAGFDHTLLVPARAASLESHCTGGRHELQFRTVFGLIEHAAPEAAVSMIDGLHIDAAAVVEALKPTLQSIVPPSVAEVRVHLHEEAIDGAQYQYTHGLKKHAGACQRIAHGHRSRVEVRRNGTRDRTAETRIASDWRDIYVGTREDRVFDSNGVWRFAYVSHEGAYELSVPSQRCDLLDGDTTVERIAETWCERLRAEARPGERIEVRAYEGVMKGAIARC